MPKKIKPYLLFTELRRLGYQPSPYILAERERQRALIREETISDCELRTADLEEKHQQVSERVRARFAPSVTTSERVS